MRWTEGPLVGLAALFLVAYAWPIIDPELSPLLAAMCAVVAWIAWGAFAGDYLVRLWLAGDRRGFARKNILDLVVIALPILRSLRVLRLVTLLRFVNQSASHSLRGKVAAYVTGGSVLLAFCAARATLDAERSHSDANITTFGDAAWWAIVTMTTVGYGDYYPVTMTGRLVAFGLMLGGIALLGVVTATIASWLIERIAAENAERTDPIHDEIRLLRSEVAELRRDKPGTPHTSGELSRRDSVGPSA